MFLHELVLVWTSESLANQDFSARAEEDALIECPLQTEARPNRGLNLNMILCLKFYIPSCRITGFSILTVVVDVAVVVVDVECNVVVVVVVVAVVAVVVVVVAVQHLR